jgi:uncharacterized protein (DUF488 family)
MSVYLTVFTIGHSNHSREHFAHLLKSVGITAVADVRSAPYSRHTPQFDRESLKSLLNEVGIAYSFLGEELGGRPRDKSFYLDGVANYEKMAESSNFKKGISRVMEGAAKYSIALLCSEHDPLDCHRCLLVGRELNRRGVQVKHILPDGALQTQNALEERLLKSKSKDQSDFFMQLEEKLASAYRERSRRVAYSVQGPIRDHLGERVDERSR